MSAETKSIGRRRLTLVGDGVLLTAGAFTVGMGIALALHGLGVAPLGEPDPTSGAFIIGLVSWLFQVSGFVVGPILAWKLNGRRFTPGALLGAAAGFPLTALVVMGVAAVATVLGWVIAPFTSNEFAGPIALAAVLGVALTLLTLWLVIAAISDLSSAGRKHVALDVARLVSAAGIIGAGALLATEVMRGGDLEGFDFLVAGGVLGGVMVATADFVERRLARRAALSERVRHA